MNEKTKERIKFISKIIIPIIISLVSIFVVTDIATSAQFNKRTIQALDDKKTTVLELTAAATATSAAITLIPGDTATPIAEKLADLSEKFLIVLCAIFLEKYLVTITGYVSFRFLIPIVCALFIFNIFYKNEIVSKVERKVLFFAIAIVCVIPVSVEVSNLIEATYQSSINETLESAKQTSENISNDSNEKDEGVVSGIISSVKNTVSLATDKVKNVLNNFIEALAVLIVTSCIIPILVIVFFVWLINTVVGTNINVNKVNFSKKRAGDNNFKQIEKID